jgi:hypothetical protein
MPSDTIAFDLTKEVDTSKSIKINYESVGVTQITNDTSNAWITGQCQRGASSNVTYSENGVTTEYKVDKLWIVGNKDGTGQTPLQLVTGIDYNAELFIRNLDTNNNDPMYTCFLLHFVDPGPENGQIDGIVRAATNGDGVTSLTVDLNADIFRKNTNDAKYIQYKGSKGRNVFIYSEPISVAAAAINGLENNMKLFDMTATDYSLIGSPVPGDWMECDYVPIEGEEATSYNLPIVSGIVQDQAANSSLKTMIMFILFILFMGISYTIIPTAYMYTAKIIFDFTDVETSEDQKSQLKSINIGLSVLIAGTAILLFFIGAGVFGNTDNIPNASLLLLIGMSLGIFYMIGYIILQSKTSADKEWPINKIQEDQDD